MRLLSTVIGVRSPLMAPPFEQLLPWPLAPPNVLCTIEAGSWLRAALEPSRSLGVAECCASTRIALPPRSGPLVAHVLRTKTEAPRLSQPPTTKMAPPPFDPPFVSPGET